MPAAVFKRRPHLSLPGRAGVFDFPAVPAYIFPAVPAYTRLPGRAGVYTSQTGPCYFLCSPAVPAYSFPAVPAYISRPCRRIHDFPAVPACIPVKPGKLRKRLSGILARIRSKRGPCPSLSFPGRAGVFLFPGRAGVNMRPPGRAGAYASLNTGLASLFRFPAVPAYFLSRPCRRIPAVPAVPLARGRVATAPPWLQKFPAVPA